MTTKPSNSNWHKLRRWPAALAASAALAAGAATVAGAPPRACLDCRYTVDGVCRPNATTYGHYQTQWRTWPKPLAVSAASLQRDPIELPTQVEPPPAQEDLDNAPRPPLLPEDMGDVPPVKPATGNESPTDHPRPAGGEQLPMPPRTDKPDPFQDDPIQDDDRRRETSILIPPLDEPLGTYGFLDEAPAAPAAIRSSYDEAPHDASRVVAASDVAALRLIGETSVANESSPPIESSRPRKTDNAAEQDADGSNPLRARWGTRGESPLRDPNVVTKFGGSTAANPLRR